MQLCLRRAGTDLASLENLVLELLDDIDSDSPFEMNALWILQLFLNYTCMREAYEIVQRNAMATWTRLGEPGCRTFRENLAADPEVAGRVAPELLDAAMNPALHLQNIDHIFARIFGET